MKAFIKGCEGFHESDAWGSGRAPTSRSLRVLLGCLQIGSLIQVPPPVFSVSLWCHASYLQAA